MAEGEAVDFHQEEVAAVVTMGLGTTTPDVTGVEVKEKVRDAGGGQAADPPMMMMIGQKTETTTTITLRRVAVEDLRPHQVRRTQ